MPNADTIRTAAIAQGRRVKRINALTVLACGVLPAVALALWRPGGPEAWLAGLLAGLVWANGFEYVYHRFLLHLPGSFFGRPHLTHHASIGTPGEAADLNLAGSPARVVLLFAANGAPIVAADLLLGLRVAPAMLLAFAAYLMAAEEIHWRIHLGGRLPSGLGSARAYHFAHHERPESRFNIFLPLFDWLLGHARG